MEIINVRGLHFSYGDRAVLEDINFTVNRGEFICVAGVNGSGKSTLLKILMGLLKADAGTVYIKVSNIAYLSQRAAAFNPDFPANVAEIVGLGCAAMRGRKAKVVDALSQVDMLGYKNASIGRLSGGQQQRVMLAKALVQQPELIILDEPTASVDSGAATDICCLLGELNKKEGVTVLMVTHDVHSLSEHADRVLQL